MTILCFYLDLDIKWKQNRITIVGENGQGNQFNQLRDLSFDQERNLYVVDCGNDRIQKFGIETN